MHFFVYCNSDLTADNPPIVKILLKIEQCIICIKPELAVNDSKNAINFILKQVSGKGSGQCTGP